MLQNVETGELRARICPSFAGLLKLAEEPSVVTVDIPIGSPEVTRPGGRLCEQQARKFLGGRASSVFSAVGRAAQRAGSRAEADQISRDARGLGIGAQAWSLAEKLKEADAAMTPERQRLIREVHPEVSFWAMNGRSPLLAGKKTLEGMLGRLEALKAEGLPSTFVRELPAGLRVGRDDFLDACAALWTARRISYGLAERLPATSDLDARGLDQAIWFWDNTKRNGSVPQLIDVAILATEQLRNLIANHRKKGATDAPLFLEALAELERRTGGGLDFDKSFAAIREAARKGECLSYKDLADASGASWSKVHYEVGGHLWRLIEYAQHRGWPMLSAIVVNKANVEKRTMEPATLKGFVMAARALGHSVTNEESFLREQQDAVFAWGRSSELP